MRKSADVSSLTPRSKHHVTRDGFRIASTQPFHIDITVYIRSFAIRRERDRRWYERRIIPMTRSDLRYLVRVKMDIKHTVKIMNMSLKYVQRLTCAHSLAAFANSDILMFAFAFV